jgi:hypothetical protein
MHVATKKLSLSFFFALSLVLNHYELYTYMPLAQFAMYCKIPTATALLWHINQCLLPIAIIHALCCVTFSESAPSGFLRLQKQDTSRCMLP